MHLNWHRQCNFILILPKSSSEERERVKFFPFNGLRRSMFVLELYQYVININRVILILIYFRRRIIIKVKVLGKGFCNDLRYGLFRFSFE